MKPEATGPTPTKFSHDVHDDRDGDIRDRDIRDRDIRESGAAAEVGRVSVVFLHGFPFDGSMWAPPSPRGKLFVVPPLAVAGLARHAGGRKPTRSPPPGGH